MITISLQASTNQSSDAQATLIQTAQCSVISPNLFGMIQLSLDVVKLKLQIQVSSSLFAGTTLQETIWAHTNNMFTAQLMVALAADTEIFH